MSNTINISLVTYKGKQNSTLKAILSSINTYLLRNKGAVSDFNLVKDKNVMENLNYFLKEKNYLKTIICQFL